MPSLVGSEMCIRDRFKVSRRPYYIPIVYNFPPFFVVVKFVFLQQPYCSRHNRAATTRPTANSIPPEPKFIRLCSLSWTKAYVHRHLSVPPVDHSKYALLCLNPVKLFLYFGHYAAPNPYNDIGTLVLYGTPGCVRGLNGWEYEWVAWSPKFNVKQHRWRESSHVFQADQSIAE